MTDTLTQARVALLQIMTTSDKEANIARARKLAKSAASDGAEIIVLPEMFVCPYEEKYMVAAKEPADERGPTFNMLRDVAIETGTYVIGGSFPE